VCRDEDVNIHAANERSGTLVISHVAEQATDREKRVQTDQQIVTGEAVALDLNLAGIGSRGIAALIDLAIMYAALIALLIPFGWLLGAGANAATASTVGVLIVVGVLLGYPVGMETLWHGRTLGKAAMGLRVVRDDGGPIRFRHALVRGLFAVFLEKPGILIAFPALLCMLISPRNKRVADYFAGTVVLQERVPGSIDAPVTMPGFMAGWAASLDLTGIDDALALRIRHFVTRANELTPQARAGLENQLTAEVVARVGQPPPNTPAWAILMAVLAERRRRAMIATQPPQPPWTQQQQWPQPQVPQPQWNEPPAPTATEGPTTPESGYVAPG
jgi:uncharacterized RDD family membrane protein YckC